MAIVFDNPTPVVVGDVLEVKAYSFFTDQLGINVGHFRVSAVTAPAPTLTDIAANLDALFAPLYKAAMTSPALWIGAAVRRIRPTVSAPAYVNNLEGPGTDGNLPMARQVAGILTLKTALGGRANRGRKYIPFPDEGASALGVDPAPSGPYIVDISAIGSAWASARVINVGAGSCTINPVIYHKVGGSTTDIVGFVPRYKWATQRKRGDYGRPNARPG